MPWQDACKSMHNYYSVMSHENSAVSPSVRRYEKVSHQTRLQLLRRVLCDNCQIKESAHELHINYSTAKTIMRKYKRSGSRINLRVLEGITDWYDNHQLPLPRCHYRIREGVLDEMPGVSKSSNSSGENVDSQEMSANRGSEECQVIEITQQMLYHQ